MIWFTILELHYKISRMKSRAPKPTTSYLVDILGNFSLKFPLFMMLFLQSQEMLVMDS